MSWSADRGDVVAAAVASTHVAANAQPNGQSAPEVDGTDVLVRSSRRGQTPAPARSSPRRRDLAATSDRLGERDWHILATVKSHRFVTTSQLVALHFAGLAATAAPTVARRTLGRLRRLGLLDTLARRIGGVRAGSAGLVFYLTDAGRRVLARDQDLPRRRFHEPSQTFLAHTLAVGEAVVALTRAAQAGQIELVAAQLETRAWRGFHQGIVPTTLKPDLYCEVAHPPGSDELVTAFIEVDLGTEHLPTLRRKCQQYAAYATSSQASEQGMPLVIWSMSTRDPTVATRRREQLARVIGRDAALDPAMFRITEPTHLVAALLGQDSDRKEPS